MHIAVHETGHILGLGHSSDPGSIMFPVIPEDMSDVKLRPDDILGIQKLYGKQLVQQRRLMTMMTLRRHYNDGSNDNDDDNDNNNIFRRKSFCILQSELCGRN